MRLPFALTRIGLVARGFRSKRADWYEYIADMIDDSEGQRTMLDILQRDARRYGRKTIRGQLSAYWAHQITETGDFGQTFAGTLPQQEIAQLASMQQQGEAVFVDGLRDIAAVVRLNEKLRAVLRITMLVSLVVFLLFLGMVFVGVPFFTAPEFESIAAGSPMDHITPSTRMFFAYAEWARENVLAIGLCLLVGGGIFLSSFQWFDGPVRRWLDRRGPYRLYRDVISISVMSVLATTVKQRAGITVPLRSSIEMLRTGANRWLSNRLTQMLTRLEDSKAGASVFDVQLLDQDAYWYLEDLTDSLGLDTALQKVRKRMETTLFKRMESRAKIVAVVLIGLSLISLILLFAWHYAIMFDLRNALMVDAL